MIPSLFFKRFFLPLLVPIFVPIALIILSIITLHNSQIPLIANAALNAAQPLDRCPEDVQSRIGINVHRGRGLTWFPKEIHDYAVGDLQLGWYLDYNYQKHISSTAELTHVPMVRPKWWHKIDDFDDVLGQLAEENPDQLWIIGNEPEDLDQDGEYYANAREYALDYHRIYSFIKERDPNAQFALAAIIQPTPLRLRYLDMVLEVYELEFGEKLPLDVMTVHNYVMSERVVPGDGIILWGSGVPLGMDGDTADARYIHPKEHWNLEIFKEQIVQMRRWMQERGYRDKPLIVSEFGILLPDEWDHDGVSTTTFMTESIDFLLSAKDDSIGYPEDENRLVQSFAWFSLNFPNYDPATESGLNGALFEYIGGERTILGDMFVEYVDQLLAECNSPVPQPTFTQLPTEQETPTANPWSTITPTHAASLTATVTYTITPLETATEFPNRPTLTPTFTQTLTSTPTMTPTVPLFHTLTPANSPTATLTPFLRDNEAGSTDTTPTAIPTSTPTSTPTMEPEQQEHTLYLPKL
ncbi:MAG: hypothetical protein AAF702_45195 [Chloroflexota bacterium]